MVNSQLIKYMLPFKNDGDEIRAINMKSIYHVVV